MGLKINIQQLPPGTHLYRCAASPTHETLSGPGLAYCPRERWLCACGEVQTPDHAPHMGAPTLDGTCDADVYEMTTDKRIAEAIAALGVEQREP